MNTFLFGIYPYIAACIFLFGSLMRFEREPDENFMLYLERQRQQIATYDQLHRTWIEKLTQAALDRLARLEAPSSGAS